MSRKYKIRDQNSLYFLTFTVIYWLDVFTRQIYKDIVIDSLKYCQKNKGLEIYAYCIMTNHIHLIVAQEGKRLLQNTIRDFKKFTSVKLIKAIQENEQESRKNLFLWNFKRAGKFNNNNKVYQFWQQHSHPIELSTNKMIDQRLEYIHQNPVKEGIVACPEDYLYSSAINYARLPDKMLDVILID